MLAVLVSRCEDCLSDWRKTVLSGFNRNLSEGKRNKKYSLLSIKTFILLSQGSVCLMTTLFLPGLLSDYLCCETTEGEDKVQLSLPAKISVFPSLWKHEQDVKGF